MTDETEGQGTIVKVNQEMRDKVNEMAIYCQTAFIGPADAVTALGILMAFLSELDGDEYPREHHMEECKRCVEQGFDYIALVNALQEKASANEH